MLDIKNVRQEAEKELREERAKEAKEKIKRKLREIHNAKLIVANLEREMIDLHEAISQGN